MDPNQKQTVDADESPNNSVYLPCKMENLVSVPGAAVWWCRLFGLSDTFEARADFQKQEEEYWLCSLSSLLYEQSSFSFGGLSIDYFC